MIVGEMKMADALLENHFLLLVIERFGISYGLKDKTIEEVCKQYEINIDVFLSVANLHKGNNYFLEVNFSDNDIVKIVYYLNNSHDYYSNEVLPGISKRIKKLSINNNNLVFNLIEQFFTEYIKEVVMHLKHEEITVYPYALSLIEDSKNVNKYSIAEYKEHHDDIESKLDDLKNLLIKHLK